MAASGPYKMFWNAGIFSTLGTYWKWSLGPSRLILFHIYPSPWRSGLTALLSIALLGFLVWKLWRREWVAGFFASWFFIVIAPLLPLRNHLMEYYLTVPLIGLAMLAGWGLVDAWRARWPLRIAAISLAAAYVAMAIPLARVAVDSFHDRSVRIRALVLGVVEHSQPGKLIVLKGVDGEMFVSAVVHRPFRLYGLNEVYLAPEDAAALDSEAQAFSVDPAMLRSALQQNQAIVLDVSGAQVRDITQVYRVQ